MGNTQIKRCSKSLLIRKNKLKPSTRQDYAPTRMVKIKKRIPGVDKDTEQPELPHIVCGHAKHVEKRSGGTWVAESVDCLTLDFGSGHDLRVVG